MEGKEGEAENWNKLKENRKYENELNGIEKEGYGWEEALICASASFSLNLGSRNINRIFGFRSLDF